MICNTAQVASSRMTSRGAKAAIIRSRAWLFSGSLRATDRSATKVDRPISRVGHQRAGEVEVETRVLMRSARATAIRPIPAAMRAMSITVQP